MVMIDFNLVGDHGRMWSLFSFTCFHISMSSSLLERSSNKSLTSGPQRVFPFFSHCAKAPEALLDGGLGKNLAFAYQAAFLVHGHLILLKCFAVSFEKQDFP